MHNHLLDRFLSTPVFFSAALLLCTPAWSADWAISPYVTMIEEYDNNILFSSEGQELDDLVTIVRPRVEVRYATDRLRLSWNSVVEAEKYLDCDEFDTIDHDHKLALSYGLSRTLGLRAGGYFREDTTLETELIEEGLLVDREDRRKFGGNLGFDYAFSKRLFFSGDWTRRYAEYPDDPDDFDDRQSDTFDLAPRYVFSPKTSLFLKMVHTKTEYDEEGDPSIANYSISPSFRHDFAEDFYISGGAGYRYTKDKTASSDKQYDGFVFDLSFHRDWKKVSMELLASRDQYSTLYESSVERDRLTLKGTYRLSTRLRTSVAATFWRNRVDGGGDDHDYFTVTPALSYDLTPTVILRGSVDYSAYDYKDIADRERFRARVQLDFKWPRLWSGK